MKNAIAGGLFVAVLMWLCGAGAATPEKFGTVLDRDDYEIGLFRDDANPAALCEYGTSNRRYSDPASACHAAYTAAMKTRTYDQAARYAAIGCEAFRDQKLCQAMPRIPFPPTAAGR